MTPEKALDILEGKIPHKEPSKGAIDEKRTYPSNTPKTLNLSVNSIKETDLNQKIESGQSTSKKPKLKEMEITGDMTPINVGKTPEFIWIFAIVSILGVLILAYLWKLDAVSRSSYKNGFNDGVASISPNLTLAQKDISDKTQQLDQLQQEIDTATHNLESVTQQKEQLAQSLKETQESLPARIGSVEQPLEEKIKSLTEESQKKISDLNNQLVLAQKDISNKGQQLTLAQKNLNDKVQQMDKLQQDLSESKYNAVLLQQEVSKISQELKLVTQQKGQSVQSLKGVQGPVPGKTSAVDTANSPD